jgi:CRISPR-associated protein (TIGR02584 family)
VAVSGQTPAIVTETLWFLCQHRGVHIDEIRVITTALGYRSIKECLLGEAGKFAAYCLDYEIPPGRIAFSEKTVYVLTRSDGCLLDDIRSSQDNVDAAERIFALIREWSQRRDEVLFCSVAGGRKTLGI